MMQGGGGASNEGSMSTVSKAEVVEQDYVGLSEVSSYPTAHVSKRVEDEAELELGLGLGLGLSLGGVKVKQCAPADYCRSRILTAKDFPSMVSCGGSGSGSSCSARYVVGTKRAADSVSQEVGSNVTSNQVVGWPPIRAYRMNNLVNQARVSAEDRNIETDNTDKNTLKTNNTKNINNNNNNNNNIKSKGHVSSLFVKVKMDGVPIGRKVDLVANGSYETLAKALEDMFQRPSINTIRSSGAQSGFENEHGMVVEGTKPSKLLDGSSDYVLTYEDKEGDWMLVGDVPWGMFLNTVKRLRIMKTSEANGLAPRFQNNGDGQRKPL